MKKQNDTVFTFRIGGKELAKVLFFYGFIPDVNSLEQKIVCPFHEDVNPSVVINYETGSWYCFGCNHSGDAYTFVEGIEKKKGVKGVKLLLRFFEILKSEKVERLNFNPRIRTKKQSEELYNIAYDYYYGLSRVDWRNTVIQEAIDAREYMRSRGFTAKTLIKTQAKVTYNKNYPIIFPMLDNGEFKGWVCRTTDKEIEKKRKYLYNGGFMRRNTLVGNYAGCLYIFVVEGYMDRLKFVQFGVENVVAILGWKMSREQEKKIRDARIKYIVCALDNDTCGRKGYEYLKSIFPNRVIRWKYLKGIKDNGEATKETFTKMYEKTMQEVNSLLNKNVKEN